MNSRPKLLLHICCAPDATAVFERLNPEYEVTGFFHNPNIYPQEEFKRRLSDVESVARQMKFPLVAPAYEPEAWCNLVQGLENEPEGGSRCGVCFRQTLALPRARPVKWECLFLLLRLLSLRIKNRPR